MIEIAFFGRLAEKSAVFAFQNFLLPLWRIPFQWVFNCWKLFAGLMVGGFTYFLRVVSMLYQISDKAIKQIRQHVKS